jgi:uncharacterized protein (TIGR00288 family)
MASSSENISMAVFCDFENVALGVRDMNNEKFDIKPVLERLLLKGSIVVKKAYCDWDRYKSFKGTMHEANFELIEIPHVRQSGKNSADIRLVVDALDLCYTKAHVDTFVIVSGDSDFSPLVSKLRENAKRVIGVGVKQSTSDLLVANCDEFIFYDDLVREIRRVAAKRDERKAQPSSQRRPTDDRKREEMEARKLQALEMVAETFDALVAERGDTGKIWASLLKDTLKRRRPDFNETYFGFRTFGNLLEEAQTRGLFEFGRDEKSGTYVFRSSSARAAEALGAAETDSAEPTVADSTETPSEETVLETVAELATPAAAGGREPRRRGGRNRKGREQAAETQQAGEDDTRSTWPAPTPDLAEEAQPAAGADEAAAAAIADAVSPEAPVVGDVAAAPEAAVADLVADPVAAAPAPAKERRRAPRKPSARKLAAEAAALAAAGQGDAAPADAAPADVKAADAIAPAPAPGTTATPEAVAVDDAEEPSAPEGEGAKAERKKSSRPAHKAPSRKPAARAPRRPAKAKTPPENG